MFLASLRGYNFHDSYRIAIPRQKLQKVLLMIDTCILNPVTEELMFRGILVHQLGLYINNHWLAITLGLLVNIGNHIYHRRHVKMSLKSSGAN
jgi:membrane protease YdiL (CAAX protease family)